jgi:hypothetical protein
MPVIPPTPWQANTSRHHQFSFRNLLTTRLLTILLNIPMNMACGMLTNPAAGVIATNPTIVIQAPIAESLCPRFYLKYQPYQQQQQAVVVSACTAMLALMQNSVETKPAKPQ